MKKLLAGFLALTLTLAFVGCNDSENENTPVETPASVSETTTVEETTTAEETTTTEAVSDPEAEDMPADNKAVADDFMKTLVSGKYTLSCSAESDGTNTDMVMSVDLANGLMHISAVSGGQVFAILLNKDGMYMIDDSSKQYMAFPMDSGLLEEYDFSSEAADFGTELSESGTGTLNGKTCDYEEYEGENGASCRLYIENGKVIAMENVEKAQLILINNMSKTVNSNVFKLPAGYSEMKLDLGGME